MDGFLFVNGFLLQQLWWIKCKFSVLIKIYLAGRRGKTDVIEAKKERDKRDMVHIWGYF